MIALLAAAGGIASAASMAGGVLTVTQDSGSKLTISGKLPSGEDYWLQTPGEGSLSPRGDEVIGGSVYFAGELGSFYAAQAVVDGRFYPVLYLNTFDDPPPEEFFPWWTLFSVETEPVQLTDDLVYEVPFRIFNGSLAAFDSRSRPFNCIVCVGLSVTGKGTLTTKGFPGYPDRRVDLLTLRWGDYAIPEPGSMSMFTIGALLLVGDFARRRKRFRRR